MTSDDTGPRRAASPTPRAVIVARADAEVPASGPPPNLLRAAPDLARVAVTSAWHLTGWSINAAFAGAEYVARRAADGEPATTIVQEAASDLRAFAWRALGVRDGVTSEALARITNASAARTSSPPTADSSPQQLRRQGDELLRRSNDVHVVEDTHPAFARILTEITPDEARILRYLYLEGPQPAIDVRTWRVLGIGSELIASGLTMIGEHAGCRNLDRMDPYLTNLSRLGLVEFSSEPVTNPQRYQVVEAQPNVLDALRRAGRMPRTVHRSILLTTFGSDFVRTCLPLSGHVVPYPLPDRRADRARSRPKPR